VVAHHRARSSPTATVDSSPAGRLTGRSLEAVFLLLLRDASAWSLNVSEAHPRKTQQRQHMVAGVHICGNGPVPPVRPNRVREGIGTAQTFGRWYIRLPTWRGGLIRATPPGLSR
jgi:hypothetical protein